GEDGNSRAPLEIHGGNLLGIHYESPIASAQVKSAILLAALRAQGSTTVVEPALSRDHTERMLIAFGADVHRDGNSVSLCPGSRLSAQPLVVPSDLSSAAFFIVAGLLVPNSDLVLQGVGVNETRDGILDALSQMGATIEHEHGRMVGAEPVADVRVTTSGLRGVEFGGELIVRMIDEIPILALAASQARGVTIVRDAAELRVKETDRIEAIATELGRIGVEVESRPDGFAIQGPQTIHGGTCESRGDHRIAMTAAIAGLTARAPVTIHGTDCVGTSFPGFWDLLKRL
ncbi:3-phosphoshikimate 1-carboxyvinyltransferase, partial [Candidatus Poribacteria bacterium]|nr:3-phosphoshikimate 1-carboxyvinyltransferase [Candidatus Poribacteria bacterium]